jgi:lactoylglutathione lyase
MGIKLKKMDVVVLFVADLQRAKVFYGDTLGLALSFEDEVSAGFNFDNVMLLLLTIPGAQDLLSNEAVAAQRASGATGQLVAFVDDVDAISKELAAQGVEFVREPIDREWGLRTAHFKDPDGNIWEIAQPVEKKPTEG